MIRSIAVVGFIGLASATVFGSSAVADGGPRRNLKDTAAAAALSWTGFYIGANAGWARAQSDVELSGTDPAGLNYVDGPFSGILAAGAGKLKDTAFTGGVQAGYNFQSANMVLGLEADFNMLKTSANRSALPGLPFVQFPATPATLSDTVSANWLATVRGRFGYAIGKALIYGTGGLAFTNLKHSHSWTDLQPPPWSESASASEIKLGWTVGAGLEWAFAPKWSFKTEYLYASFDTVESSGQLTGTGVSTNPATVFNHAADLTVQTVRAGVNYRF